MKKLIAGLFTALLTTAGLVAVTSTVPASAECIGYVCIPTTTNATAIKTVKAGKSVKVKVAVRVQGNVEARGDIILSVDGPGGYSQKMRLAYNGDAVSVNLGKLTKPGKYKYTAKFFGDEGFRNSSDTGTITVKKKD